MQGLRGFSVRCRFLLTRWKSLVRIQCRPLTYDEALSKPLATPPASPRRGLSSGLRCWFQKGERARGRPRKPYFRESDGWWVSRFNGASEKLATGRLRVVASNRASPQYRSAFAAPTGCKSACGCWQAPDCHRATQPAGRTSRRLQIGSRIPCPLSGQSL